MDPAVRRSVREVASIPSAIDTTFVTSNLGDLKNVTVTLPEDTALWLRGRGAQPNRSVSSWLADMIEGARRREGEYEIAMERALAR